MGNGPGIARPSLRLLRSNLTHPCQALALSALQSWPSPVQSHQHCSLPTRHWHSISCCILFLFGGRGSQSMVQSFSWELADDVTGSWNLVGRAGIGLPRRKEDVESFSFPTHRKLWRDSSQAVSEEHPLPPAKTGCQGGVLARSASVA